MGCGEVHAVRAGTRNQPLCARCALRQLAAGERLLTHAALDELPDSMPLRHLRSTLVATGALPTRDEHMARLERWIGQTISDRDNPSSSTSSTTTPTGT